MIKPEITKSMIVFWNNTQKGKAMLLVFIVILGAILGFSYGLDGNGFVFSSKICLFAGITLIMPSLFQFKFSHIQLIWQHKALVIKSFAINYLLLPLFAIGIGLLTQDFGITAGLFLLSVLSGGGMVMHWIKKTKGDTSFGFLLLFINLLAVSLSLFMLDVFAKYSADYFDVVYQETISITQFTFPIIVLLILVPFVISRIIIEIKPLVQFIQKYTQYISHISIFIILFYLFGLQKSQLLIDIYDFYPELFALSFIAVLGFYFLTLITSLFLYKRNSPQEIASFWHSITRYLTLALVISTFSISTFGVSMLLPIMFAYLVQIPLSVYIQKKYMQ
jgi:hypothetical protein